MVIGSAMELVFFSLYNGRFHPFGKIIISEDNDGRDLEQSKSSFWTDKFNFLRKWNNIKNAVHMTADQPKTFCNQTQDINTFSKNTVVNGELSTELKVIPEIQSLNNKNSVDDEFIVQGVNLDETNESMMVAKNIISDLGEDISQDNTKQQTSVNDQEPVENVLIDDKQKKEWHFLSLMVLIILLFGLFTGMAVVFGLGLNVQIGKSLYDLSGGR